MGLSDYSENVTNIEQYPSKQRGEDEKRHVQLGQMGEKSQQIGFAESVTINNVLNGPGFNTDQSGSQGKSLEDELVSYRKQFELYNELGIINCTQTLKGSELEPIKCMPDVKKSLDFTGVGGEKWVKDAQLRKAFESMLLRTKSVGGVVRFLLIDPSSEAYANLYQLRGESVPFESYEKFIELKKRHKNLQVRLYDHMPSFRMQFVDEKYLAVSRYYFDKKTHDQFEGGWMIPHLIIQNATQEYGSTEIKHKWSLYESFQLAYEFSWDQGRDIMDWNKEGRQYNKG